jgi:menaquinone-specific isochorismate synthase
MSDLPPTEFSAIEREAAAWLASRSGATGFVAIAVPVPAVDPARLLAASRGDAFVYRPGHGAAYAGLGEVCRLDARGAGRFAALQDQARAFAPSCEVLDLAGAGFTPRFFGGLAFAPGGADTGAWAPFGDGSFVLPRWLYQRDGERALLALTLRGKEIGERTAGRWQGALATVRARLSGAEPASTRAASAAAPRPRAAAVAMPPAAEVLRHLERAAEALDAGRFEKVVTALRIGVRSPLAAHPLAAFDRLSASPAGQTATTFLFRRGGSTFFGASPELLVARAGLELRSEALAGSRPAAAADALLTSAKDAREHQLVVDAIRAALAPLCSELHVHPRCLRGAGGISHLATPIAGRLSAPLHLLEIAARLHPTPAVGGWPRRPALEFLAAEEPAPRGWYAGPIGHFDVRGDGELRVALRCALARDGRAEVYAGAGIVAGSEPIAELTEMVAKARPALEALGVTAPANIHPPFTSPMQAATRQRTAGRQVA